MKKTPISARKDKTYKFLLFVSGMSSKSISATENFRSIADEYLGDDFELEIIDIRKDRQLALQYQIIGLPTLIKLNPQPTRVILGDLSEKEKVLKILNIIE